MHAPEVGNRVRIDISDPTDPDFDRFHRRHGTVVRILNDDARRATGNPRDSQLYRIELDDGHEQNRQSSRRRASYDSPRVRSRAAGPLHISRQDHRLYDRRAGGVTLYFFTKGSLDPPQDRE